MLRIKALGELVVVRDGRRVGGVVSAPTAQALLTLVACHARTGLSRARAEVLLAADDGFEWERDLGALRDALGAEHLAVDGDVVVLDAGAANADVADFQAAIADGNLERAVRVHEGRLVEGFHHRAAPAFDRWLQLERESLASDAAAALERLAEDATRRGEHLTAVRWWRALAAQHPLNDRIAASLMEALIAAGDREGALRHARFHEALAAERLELPGDAQVLEMARTLRGAAAPVGGALTLGASSVLLAPGDRVGPPADPLAHFRAAIADRYAVEGEVGRGAHGLVLRARDVRHRRDVAIKLVRAELAPVVGTTRFLREIRVAATLQHPNIVPLFDSGTAADVVYYVMPFVAGPSLRQRLNDEGTLPVDEAVAIARQTASALAEAHRRGVVHRDVKPENVLLCAGQAVVADFGIASALDGATDGALTHAGLTEPGHVVGTPAYMSPEQASPGADVDGRADVYSLACVLYEMLAGRPPFTGGSTRALIARHAADAPPPLRALRPDVSPALERVVHVALGKRPEDRHATADAFADALAASLTASLAARDAAAPARAPGRAPGRARGVATLLLMLLLLVAAAALGGAAARTTTAGTSAAASEEDRR